MTRDDLKSTQAALLRRRKSLLQPGWVEDAAQCRVPDYVSTLSQAERIELANIYGALDRIEFGGYGACVKCGGAIESRRLDAAPWEPHCESCASEELGDVTNRAA